ncbi:MAG: 30S ribosomal protein S1 [Oscillospiraceae bacterium]|nr:30S ribosomal protein S1 [Oscillospiraceae bacterium]
MTIYKPEGSLLSTASNISNLKSVSALYEAMNQGKILEAMAVTCDFNHNLIVDLGCMKGIIPRVEAAIGIDDGSVRDIAIISRVNKPTVFKITEIKKDQNGNNYAVLSRKAVQLECKKYYIDSLSKGDIIPVTVTHLEPFGCFVDIGCGIISMIPIDFISVSRISHPSDRFYGGQNIYAVIKEIDQSGKITLSHKELLGTWEENAQDFNIGETVSGIIRSVEDYGIFVELTPNLAGLAEPRENVYAGQSASVYIKNIIPEKMKIKLIIVDSFNTDRVIKSPKYFKNSGHINEFTYSPITSNKLVKTIF